MEIKQFLSLYKEHSPEEFFNWLSKGKTIEVRFLTDVHGNKFNNWDLIKTLASEFNLPYRYNSLFITKFLHLHQLLLYKLNKWPLTRLYNIFVGVNPRRKVDIIGNNGLAYKSFYGGIAGTSHIQTILCDIEQVGERVGNATEDMLEECIQGAKYIIKVLELTDYWINISGNGVHLWIALNPAIELPIPTWREVTIKDRKQIKYNLKEEPINGFIKTYNNFITKLNRQLQSYNPRLKVDEGAKDISRIARPPGSWNIKVRKAARAVGTVAKENKLNIIINQKFTAAKPLLNQEARKYKEIKSQSKNHRYNALNLRESPICQLLLSRLLPSTLSRNHFLEQSLARLLRDNDITEDSISELVAEIDAVQQKTIQVDPDYLDDNEPFNAETINSYCYTCKIDFIYPIMEDVPKITDGYISISHYDNLNSYSEETLKTMSIKDFNSEIPNSYFELKSLIRNLVDKYDRASVFFTLKLLLKDDWKFLGRTRLIQKIMNKTRKRVEV